jgi:hypothetical protein
MQQVEFSGENSTAEYIIEFKLNVYISYRGKYSNPILMNDYFAPVSLIVC